MAISLEGKAVVITGCDTGIGRILALGLASKHGVKVFAGCLTESGAEELSQASEQRVITFPLDVTSNSSVAVAVDFVKRHLEGCPLFALINNAGINKGFFIEFTDVEEYKSVLNVNFLGMVRMTKAFLPSLAEARGRIVKHCELCRISHCPRNLGLLCIKVCCCSIQRLSTARAGVTECESHSSRTWFPEDRDD